MAQLFVNPQLISQLNIIFSVPLPLFKLINDWIKGMLLNTKQSILLTYYKLQNICIAENIHISIRQPVQTLTFLIKIALKGKFPQKILKNLIQQNTILQEPHLNYLLETYQSIVETPINTHKCGTLVANSWALYSLKKYQNKDMNKMYARVVFKTQKNGQQAVNAMAMTLTQFRVFLQETQKVTNSLNR